MGAGASVEMLNGASVADVAAALKDCSPETIKKLKDALAASTGTTPEFCRITQLPIKPNSMADLGKIFNKPEFRKLCESFAGLLGVEFLAAGDETMIASWRWVSQAAGDGAAAELGKGLMGFMGDYIAGKPSAAVGTPLVRMDLKPNAAKTVYRAVTFTFKDAAALEDTLNVVNAKQDAFSAIDGLVDLTWVPMPDAEKTSLFGLQGYDTMASLEAAGPKIGEIAAEFKDHLGGPPEMSAATIQWKLPLPFCRITQLPIKPNSMADLGKIFNKPEFRKLCESFAGLLGVEFLAAGDETMIASWRWVSQAAGDGAAAELGKGLMGFMGDYIAGKPSAAVGTPLVRMDLKPNAAKTVYRAVTFTFKDAAALEATLNVVNAKQEAFSAIDGLVDLTWVPMPDAEKTSLFGLQGYDTMASLEAAGPKIGEIAAEFKDHLGGPPEMISATVQWKLPEA